MNPLISMVACADKTATKDTHAVAVIELIRSGRWRKPVEQIRAEYVRAELEGGNPRDAVAPLKKRLPGVLVSGVFERRNSSALRAHSGLLGADLDGLPSDQLDTLKKQIQEDQHVWACFVSPTGTGLKIWFRVSHDAALHPQSFFAVQRHCRHQYGIEVDISCKDVARLCFVSWDPDAHLNPDAIELPVEPTVPKRIDKQRTQLISNGSLPDSAARLLANGAQQGQRNAECLKLCCQLRDSGLSESDARARVLEFAARCQPPFAEPEALVVVRSTYQRPPREPARKQGSIRPVSTANEYIPSAAEIETVSRDAGAQSDEEVYRRLGELRPADYDRCREAEAEKLKIRVATLDAEVARRRPQNGGAMQGSAVDFAPIEPWPQPVNGAEMLESAAQTFSRYVALPPGAADALSLWAVHAHCFDAFQHTPRLNLCSPDKGCGKTLVLDVMATLVPRPLRTESITCAVLFRMVESHKPVLLLDEIDTYLPDSEELRGLLNSGHKRGAKAYRCEGEKNEVRGFAAFAPAVLAGIGSLPGTLHDRSIVVRLTRAKLGEVPVRFDSRRTILESEICRKIARWVIDNRSRLEQADPPLPATAYNRLGDNWRPLFSIATVVGDGWLERAGAAFAALTTGKDFAAQGIGTTLLADIRAIFESSGTDRLATIQIATALGKMEGKPWPEFKKDGTPISANQVARLLSKFEIESGSVRLTAAETAKGFYLTQFKDAFDRYLPIPSLSKGNTGTSPANIGDSSLFKAAQPNPLLPFENTVSPNDDGGCARVTFSKGGIGEPAGYWADGTPFFEPGGPVPECDKNGQIINLETEDAGGDLNL